MVAISATGQLLNPMLILQGGKDITADKITVLDERFMVSQSESGYLDAPSFYGFIESMVHQLDCSRANPAILYLDGYDHHWDHQSLKLASDNFLYMRFIPSHLSHLAQPLDLHFNAIAKSLYKKQLERFRLRYGNLVPMTPRLFSQMISNVWCALTMMSYRL